MPQKIAKTGQQPGKTDSRGKWANVDMANASKTQLDSSNESNTQEVSETPEAPVTPEAQVMQSLTNSDILKEIMLLKR